MSYALGVRGSHDEILDKLEEQVKDVEASGAYEHTPGMAEAVHDHLKLAQDLVSDIVESGKVVKPGQHVSVSISGHANPEHVQLSGWANDCLTIAIGQIPPPRE